MLLASTVYSDEPDKKLHNECLYPTVMLYEPIQKYVGSAVVVRSEKFGDEWHNVAVTANHVSATSQNSVVRAGVYEDWSKFVGYRSYWTQKVYASKPQYDLSVVLFISDRELPVAKINMDGKVYIGNQVFRFGCGLGDQFRLDRGEVTSVNAKIGDLKDMYRTSITTVEGDSGGPVFNKDYEVVGITSAIRARRDNPFMASKLYHISFIVPVTKLKTLRDGLDNEVKFVYDASEPLPVIPYFEMKMRNMTFVEEGP